MEIDLSDVTVIIPLRVDSQVRLSNINTLLSYLQREANVKIVVIEADYIQKAACLNHLDINYRFIKDEAPVFHHTRYRNEMIKTCTSPIIAVWDVDVFAPMDQLLEAVEKIRTGKAVVTWPYNGILHNVPAELGEQFRASLDLEQLISRKNDFSPLFGGFSVGGIFLADRMKYREAGMENENIYGWGPEDMERLKRITILDMPCYRVKGELYHLCHPRGINYFNYDTDREIRNFNEYFKVCSFTREELLAYINSWKWIAE